jgi:hypothetical protein
LLAALGRGWMLPMPATHARGRMAQEHDGHVTLFVVTRRYGPPYVQGLSLEEQQYWEAHQAFMNALEAEGLVRLGGPLEEREDVLLIFRAKDKDEIERRLADDPWSPASSRPRAFRAGTCGSGR